uniref:CCHC-type domain-containing protein n=1 Tax=Strongyloides venezuelensis TaxID=75913 RepID=A0A0K0EXC7_STRVS
MISTLSSNFKLNEVIERLRYQDELKTPEITENASFYAKRYSKSNNHKFSTNNRFQRKCYNCSCYGHFADVCTSFKKEKVNNLEHEEENDEFSNGIVFSLDEAGEAVINNVLIKNIFYSPEVNANLLSYALLKKSGQLSVSSNQESMFNIDGKLISTKISNGDIIVYDVNKIDENQLCHGRLGHACSQAMKSTINKDYQNYSVF